MPLWPPVVPHEHGSWGTFGGLIFASVLALGINLNVVLTLIAGVGLFLAREPLSQAVKRRFGRHPQPVPRALLLWAAIYLTVSAAAAGLLILRGELIGLLWLGLAGSLILAVHLLLARHRKLVMSAWGEWLGVLGVSLIAPALYLAVHGVLEGAVGLWLIGLLQVSGPIPYIRLKVRIQARLPQAPPLAQRLRAAWLPLLFVPVSLLMAYGLGLAGWAPPRAWLALLPSAVKHLWGAWHWTPRGQLDIRRLGWIEVANVILFALILGWAYRI
jgi:hypothetical protein